MGAAALDLVRGHLGGRGGRGARVAGAHGSRPLRPMRTVVDKPINPVANRDRAVRIEDLSATAGEPGRPGERR